ncbi:MAG: hypothetical protein HC912_11575 [Saprospiraceae bacterium]|nr:hypothetical protein [Saprospiraceae bacterium]
MLDCESNQARYIPLHLGEYALVLIDSKVKHSLAADSGYNERRHSCERVVATIQKVHPEVDSLRKVTMEQLRHSKHNWMQAIINARNMC